ncbi:MAG: hypothetical protein J6C26_02830 [Clostridia bacterium]|nr:hypothetical protein [Clostridia bacterium]
MLNLRETEKAFLATHVFEGCVAVDFTMGNGNDTLWLSHRAGQKGRVYAFDIQPEAVARTAERMKLEAPFENYRLICASHHTASDYVSEPIDVGIFNLGFLPGGDKGITTLRQTTLPAVRWALSSLASKGALLIAVYPGHEEGRLEGEMLQEELSALPPKQYSVSCLRIVNAPDCPFFYLIEKNK